MLYQQMKNAVEESDANKVSALFREKGDLLFNEVDKKLIPELKDIINKALILIEPEIIQHPIQMGPKVIAAVCFVGNKELFEHLFLNGGSEVKAIVLDVIHIKKGSVDESDYNLDSGDESDYSGFPDNLDSEDESGYILNSDDESESNYDKESGKEPEKEPNEKIDNRCGMAIACYGENIDVLKYLFEQNSDAAQSSLTDFIHINKFEIAKILFQFADKKNKELLYTRLYGTLTNSPKEFRKIALDILNQNDNISHLWIQEVINRSFQDMRFDIVSLLLNAIKEDTFIKKLILSNLEKACQNGQIDFLRGITLRANGLTKVLIDNLLKDNIENLFAIASKNDHYAIIRFLYVHDKESLKNHAAEILIMACQEKDAWLINSIINKEGDAIVEKNIRSILKKREDAAEILLKAVSFPHKSEIVKIIFEHDRNVISLTLKNACQNGEFNFIKDIFQVDNSTKALMLKDNIENMFTIALQNGHYEIAKFLYEQDNESLKDHADKIFILACQKQDFIFMNHIISKEGNALVELILEKEKEKETIQTVFNAACSTGNLEIVKLILKHDKTVKISPELLTSVYYSRHSELLKLLCEQSEESAINAALRIAQSACRNGDFEIVQYLGTKFRDTLMPDALNLLRYACGGPPKIEIINWLVKNDFFQDKEMEAIEILRQYNLLEHGKLLIPKIKIYDLPVSRFIDIYSENPSLIEDINAFLGNPVSYLEAKKFSSIEIEAMRLLQLENEAKKAAFKKYEDPESAQNAEMLEQAAKHFDEKVMPHFQDEFNKLPGDTEHDKILYIESKIRRTILNRVLRDPQTSQEIKDFIIRNHIEIEQGQMHLNLDSNSNVNHIAWRALDKDAPCVVWTNIMTANSENGFIARKRVAVYFLAVMDEHYPEEKESRIANFIGQLADIRRAHNNIQEGVDNPSCYPGTLGRIANMGAYHPDAALPKNSIELAIDVYDSYVLEHFRHTLDKILEENDNDLDMAEPTLQALFDGLTALSLRFSKEVITGQREYQEHHLNARLDFLNQLAEGKYKQEGIEAIVAKVEEIAAHNNPNIKILAEERPLLMVDLLDIGGNNRDQKLGTIYEKYVSIPESLNIEERKEAVEKSGFNPYEKDSDPYLVFSLFGKTALTYTKDVAAVKELAEALFNTKDNLIANEFGKKSFFKKGALAYSNKIEWLQLLQKMQNDTNDPDKIKLIKKISEHINVFWTANPLEKIKAMQREQVKLEKAEFKGKLEQAKFITEFEKATRVKPIIYESKKTSVAKKIPTQPCPRRSKRPK